MVLHIKINPKRISFGNRAAANSQSVCRDRLRADLLRSVSHDVRTPLTYIAGSAELLLENGDKLSEQAKLRLISGIKEEAERLAVSFENILVLTRFGSDVGQLSVRPELAEEVIAEAALNFRRRHESIRVITKLPSEPIFVLTEAKLIERLMQNLLENSVTHGGADTITISLRAESGTAFFRFSDNGSGIRPDILEQLFSELPAGGTAAGSKSMGLGLALCKRIVELHGGSLSCSSTETGAEFEFSLPAESGDKNLYWEQTQS